MVVLFLEKGKILVPYDRENHIENVGSFTGFKTKDGEDVFVASPAAIHHVEFLRILHEKLPTIDGDPLFIGTAYNGSVLRDEICFSHESDPRFRTPKENWGIPIKIFGFHVVSVEK